MKRFSSLIFCCIAALSVAQYSHAAIIIDIGEVSIPDVNLPQTVSLPVTIFSDDPANDNVSSVNLPFVVTTDSGNLVNDDNTAALTFPAAINGGTVPAPGDTGVFSSDFFGNAGIGNPSPLASLVDYDFIANAGAASVGQELTFIGGATQTLFNLEFQVTDQNVQAGDLFIIDFERNPLTGGAALDVSEFDANGVTNTLAMGTGAGEFTLSAGSITITGDGPVDPPVDPPVVPEPNGLALMFGAFLGLIGICRKR